MSMERAAPCRHSGAAPERNVDRVAQMIRSLGGESSLLRSHGLSSNEFIQALPTAIERLRGSAAASNAERRHFLASICDELLSRGLISKLEKPRYGQETVYKLTIPQFGPIAIIQKGCPDGAHSSTRWEVPEWAKETYLWWLCPSLANEPGHHITKGVYRLRKRFLSDAPGELDGVIFQNELCGSASRPCPKFEKSIVVDERSVPPPCIYLMPKRDSASDWNWDCSRSTRFADVLLQMFGIAGQAANTYIGHIGFQKKPNWVRISVTSRFGVGKSTVFRS
jgi:hypothetical protein